MGLEQYEADGRPDGRRVHGEETLLHFHRARIHAANQSQPAVVFELTSTDCADIFDEATAFFHRLLVLFYLKEWARVERDAAQVLCLLEFARQYARCAEDRVQLDPWRPRITRIHTVARAMILLEKGQYRDASLIARDTVGIPRAFGPTASDCGKLTEALLESAVGSLAPCPVFHPHGESSFIRQDDYWTIRYHGHTAFLKCTRGLRCLAVLLRSPDREFHVSELLANLPAAQTPSWPVTTNGEHGPDLATVGLFDGAPILDPQAKAECKRRLGELRQEMEEAERFNDRHRAAKANAEREVILQHLVSAVGLGGRDRKTSSDAERARSAVTKRIKKAIQKIAKAIPPLGHHLTVRIKTGYFCSYKPHPDHPVAWKF
ncbi:MAG TPA: hypothetical protein VGM54_17735 [Chthoniobacter sp.]